MSILPSLVVVADPSAVPLRRRRDIAAIVPSGSPSVVGLLRAEPRPVS